MCPPGVRSFDLRAFELCVPLQLGQPLHRRRPVRGAAGVPSEGKFAGEVLQLRCPNYRSSRDDRTVTPGWGVV